MTNEQDVKRLLEKVDKVTKEKKLDLSSDEDLSIAIMNLISIEEHLFFTAEKTGHKERYYELLREVREMRKELLKKIIKDYEGEIWCISKHLLATSMRLMEVGTKMLGKGDKKEAHDLFDKAYKMYSLFWAINLNMIKVEDVKQKGFVYDSDIKRELEENKELAKDKNSKINLANEDKSFFSKVGDALKKAIDCCKE
jgi:hypothetical protein